MANGRKLSHFAIPKVAKLTANANRMVLVLTNVIHDLGL